jgi:hypothetical protein
MEISMANEQKDSGGQKNEGEGNKTAARHYNKDQQEFVKSGQVQEAAKKAEDALDGPEGAELSKAEEKGRAKSKGEDAADYMKKKSS